MRGKTEKTAYNSIMLAVEDTLVLLAERPGPLKLEKGGINISRYNTAAAY
jgi:hypothetical protein